MRFRPGSVLFSVFLGLLAGIGPMSTDMYLPALPVMADYFNASDGEIQLTLSAYLFGYAIGQVIYGPISDRLGRRPVLAVGLISYVAISLLCVVLPTVELLIAARFLQALSGSAPIVLGRAIIRDLFSGDEAARQLALVVALMGLTPTVAPLFGSLLQVSFGWQSIFVAFALAGGTALLVVRTSLPETLRQKLDEPFSPAGLIKGFGEILKNTGFRAYTAMVGCTYAGMFGYFVGSPFILQQHFGFSELLFGVIFGSSAVVFLLGSAAGARLNRRYGGEWVLGCGAVLLALGGVGVLAGALLAKSHVWAFVGPVWVYMVGVGFAFPQAIAGGLMPFGHRAGTASSVIGFGQSMSAATLVLCLSTIAAGSFVATGAAMTFLGGGTLAIFATTRRIRLR